MRFSSYVNFLVIWALLEFHMEIHVYTFVKNQYVCARLKTNNAYIFITFK